jgi:hypothetical protein
MVYSGSFVTTPKVSFTPLASFPQISRLLVALLTKPPAPLPQQSMWYKWSFQTIEVKWMKLATGAVENCNILVPLSASTMGGVAHADACISKTFWASQDGFQALSLSAKQTY